MKRMSTSNVLIVGLDGLGIEIGEWSLLPSLLRTLIRFTAKNIALAGVKSLTIFDPEPVTIKDLGTQVRFQSALKRAVLMDF